MSTENHKLVGKQFVAERLQILDQLATTAVSVRPEMALWAHLAARYAETPFPSTVSLLVDRKVIAPEFIRFGKDSSPYDQEHLESACLEVNRQILGDILIPYLQNQLIK